MAASSMPLSARYAPALLERRDPADRQDADDIRSPFEVDRARIVHAAAFRRLQGKTQIFGVGEGDFFRTRLTHSMEAAQIGKGLALKLNAHPELAGGAIAPELVEAACLAHDLGHPPFGHNGEAALQACMQAYGGFEGNAQTLRILTRLEPKRPGFGLDLTRGTHEAVLKYLRPYSACKAVPGRAAAAVEKCYYDAEEPVIAWLRPDGERTLRTLEAQIMDWADDVAYSVHDLEDGLHAGLIRLEELRQDARLARVVAAASPSDAPGLDGPEVLAFLSGLLTPLAGLGSARAYTAGQALTSRLIHRFVTAASLEEGAGRGGPGLLVEPAARREVAILKAVEFVCMIRNPRMVALEHKGRRVVKDLFEVLAQPDAGDLFPEAVREAWEEARSDEAARLRVVCDTIAALTDAHAVRLHARLFRPGADLYHDEF